MKNIRNDSNFLVVCISCVVLMLMMCYFSIDIFIRDTYASFGGVTGSLTIPKNVIYYSNWPDSTDENEKSEYSDKKQHVVLNNMFVVPDGYEFSSWNTSIDGTGELVSVGEVIDLSDNVDLYAQWRLIVFSYGDVNLNGNIDENDYLLVREHILGNSFLDGQALRNADVNKDSKIDIVDVDIIEQAYLGTEGYTGYLPNNPILIYELYEESIEIENGTGNDNTSDNNDSSGNGSGSGNNYGNGTGTGGNASTGSNTNGNVDGNSSSNNDYNDGNLGSEDSSKVVKYEFKFMDGGTEYAVTSCDVLESDTCDLLLPNGNPTRKGYRFSGWSLSEDCSVGSVIIGTKKVNSSNTYYACFVQEVVVDEDDGGIGPILVVIALWIMAISLICKLVFHFKKKEKLN